MDDYTWTPRRCRRASRDTLYFFRSWLEKIRSHERGRPEMYRILEQIDRGHLFGWDSPLAKRIEKALRKANGERQ